MADIFISYTKSEIALTQQLARNLANAGFTVWWDSSLSSGEQFRDIIDRELNAAKVAIVIWTPASIRSPWVLAEADHAFQDGKLVPVRIPELEVRLIPKPYGTL